MRTLEIKGRFGIFGGQFVPETLMPALDELEQAYQDRTYYMPWVGVEYPLYSLHSDPRFAALLKKMGLEKAVWKK